MEGWHAGSVESRGERIAAWPPRRGGAALGFVSGLTGVGGGIFLSPLLLFTGWATFREAAGASAVFILIKSRRHTALPPEGGAWVRIGDVKYHRVFVLAILIYLTLDLSLAAMPGAFVFAPADSAEGTEVRARGATETVVLPGQSRDPGFVLFQPPLEVEERLAPVSPVERRGQPVVSWQSRAQYDPAPPSEDPH
jgi:hypothetical protein